MLLSRVDKEDKARWQITTQFGDKPATFINESGLYSLILSSKLPQAKDFKHWVNPQLWIDMLKNWKIQGLIVDVPNNRYKKVAGI